MFTRFCYILPALSASLVMLFSGTCYVRAYILFISDYLGENTVCPRIIENLKRQLCQIVSIQWFFLLLKLTPDGETRGLTITEVNLII